MKEWGKKKDDKIFRTLFISSSSREFFVSLFSIFFPIFLLTQGLHLAFVVGYFLIRYFLGVFTVYPIMKFISKIGIKKTFLIATIMAIPFYSFLYFSEFLITSFGAFLFLGTLIILDKFCDTTYWYAYHLTFSECNNKKNISRHLGEISSFTEILLLASPFIGGLLASIFSFEIVLIIVLTFLVISLLPLIFINYPKVPSNFSLKELISLKSSKRNKVYFIEGFYGVINGILWPIYLYLLNLGFTILGLFATLVKVVRSGTKYFLGLSLEKNKTQGNFLSKVGLFFMGIGVFLRGFLFSLKGLFLAQSISALGNPFFNMPIIENMYQRSEEKPVLSIMGRELFLNMGRFTFTLIFLIFVLIFDTLNLHKLFLFTGILFILISLIKRIQFIYISKIK